MGIRSNGATEREHDLRCSVAPYETQSFCGSGIIPDPAKELAHRETEQQRKLHLCSSVALCETKSFSGFGIMLIIRRRRCLPEAHRIQPPRTPDARSCRPSERDKAGALLLQSCKREGSPDRASGDEDGLPPCARKSPCRSASLPKMRMAPCRASIRLPFPTSPKEAWCTPPRPTCGDKVLRMVTSRQFRRCATCNRIYDEPFFRIAYATRLPTA
jgi:hypothetical protein